MALPKEYLKKSPEQQRAVLRKAIGAYKAAPPDSWKQKCREALIEGIADSQSPAYASQPK